MSRALWLAVHLGVAVGLRYKSPAAAGSGNYSGYVVLRAEPKTKAEVDMLSEASLAEASVTGVDFWREPFEPGLPVVMMLDGSTAGKAMSYLKSNGIEFAQTISDVQAQIHDSTPSPMIANANGRAGFAFDQFHTLDAIYTWMRTAAASNPDTELISIGSSYEGRDVMGLKINGGRDLPIIFMLCGIHSREWVTQASCVYIADKLAKGQAGSAMAGFEWHIVPAGNPDGYVWTWEGDRMWRKTRKLVSSRCTGIDPNRNWDFAHCQEWGERRCSDAYCGSTAFSEVETSNVAFYVKALQDSGRDVRSYIDVHAFSQMWMWPWGYTRDLPVDETAMAKCGNAGARALESVNGMYMRTGTISRTIYKCGGTSLDWIYANLGIKYTYALELRDTGRYGFLLPANQIVPAASEFMEGLEAMAACIA